MNSPLSIDLDISERLEDKEFRQSFFLAESSAKIAQQLIRLRKRRVLTQAQVAALAGTKQPAVSRAERADYQNWSFSALRSLADALDARLRVTIEASEDVLWEYRAEEEAKKTSKGRPRLSDQSSAISALAIQSGRASIASWGAQKQGDLLPNTQNLHGSLRGKEHGIEGDRL